jgi:hypothetical protein
LHVAFFGEHIHSHAAESFHLRLLRPHQSLLAYVFSRRCCLGSRQWESKLAFIASARINRSIQLSTPLLLIAVPASRRTPPSPPPCNVNGNSQSISPLVTGSPVVVIVVVAVAVAVVNVILPA